MSRADLKDHTAWNHMQTATRASERVSSWPEWKRNATLFRESNEDELDDGIDEKDVAVATLNEEVRKIA